MQTINRLIDDTKIELTKRDTFKDRLELINKVIEGIKRVAKKHSRSREQEKDFNQEGLICAIEMFDRYSEYPKDQLVLMTGAAIYRRVCSIQRSNITFDRKHELCDNYEERFRNPDGYEDDYETSDFVKILMTRLSAIDKRILKEKISPEQKTINLMLTERDDKIKRKEAGELVMNIDKNEITSKHIAKSIGISKATVSRGIKRIQEEVKSLIQE